MAEPARYLADLVGCSGQPAWLHRVTYVWEALRSGLPGVPHGMGIPSALSVPGAGPGEARLTEADRAMGRLASGIWV